MTDQDQALQVVANAIITLGLLALAGYIAFLGAPKEAVAIIVAIGGPALLWRHSGRRRRARRGPPAALLPLACAAQLAYGCQGGSVGGSLSWEGARWPWGAPAPLFNADYIRLEEKSAWPGPSGYTGLWASNVDHKVHFRTSTTADLAQGVATGWQVSAGTPGSAALGDCWADSTASYRVYCKESSGNLAQRPDLTAPGPIGGGTPDTGAFTTLKVAGAPTAAAFFKTCTLTSAAAATPVVCLSAADVPSSLSAKLAKWSAYVNGGTGWGTTTSCVIEDTAGNDLVSIAVAALTSNTFVADHSANVTQAARYRLGTGGATDAGLQVSCNANGTGSDIVFTLSGSIQ